MTKKVRGALSSHRAAENQNYRIITVTVDADTIAALDALIDRFTAADGKPLKTSEAVRRAVQFMERSTRKGDQ